MEKNQKLNRLPEQPTSYIPLGQPGHWTQEIDRIAKAGRPLRVRKLPTTHPRILLQALLWQLDRFIPYDAIIDLLWGDDPDGGPLNAQNVIAVMVHRLRQQGHKIETWHGIGLRMRSNG